MKIKLTIRDKKNNTSETIDFENTREVLKHIKDNNIDTNKHLFDEPEEALPISKVWNSFYSKIKMYKNIPVDEWDDYQFLGFIQSKIRFPLNVLKVEPGRHPVLLRVRRLIAEVHFEKLMSRSFDRQRMMEFLSYSFQNEQINDLNDLFSVVHIWKIQNPLISF